MKKNILILGADSQLGKSLQRLKTKHRTVFATHEEVDLTDFKKVAAVFSNGWDYCINTAAYTSVDKAEGEPEKAFLINSVAVENLAKVCNINNVSLIHISTDYVFSGNTRKPYLETDSVQPLNIYGQSKAEGEKSAIKYNPSTYIIRTAGLYSEFGNNFVKTMLHLGQKKNIVRVVNDQWNTPTYAKDLAQMLFKIIDKDLNYFGIFHYTNEGQTTWSGFAQTIFKIKKMNVTVDEISAANYPALAQRPLYSVLDKTKIKKAFGIKIPTWQVSLKNMLSEWGDTCDTLIQ